MQSSRKNRQAWAGVGERGDGQDGLAGQFRAVRGGAGGEAEVVAVAVSGGCAAGGRGVAAADVVPVPFDERELGCSGQLLRISSGTWLVARMVRTPSRP